MKLEKIKAIPKYMVEIIRKADFEQYPSQDGHTRFYAYLTKNDGELVKVTVAVKNKYRKWHCKPVAVHGVHSKKCYGQDIYYFMISGYVIKWYKEDFVQTQKPFDIRDWGWGDDSLFDPYAPVVNKEYAVEKFPEYRYSAVEKYPYGEVIKYLRYYEQYPQVEYLTKLGLNRLVFSKMILKQISKDKQFVKWLVKNKENISKCGYYVAAILKAYKKKKPIDETDYLMRAKKQLQYDRYSEPVKELFKNDLDRFFLFLKKQNASAGNYSDYLTACIELGLDMAEEKNRYPHDFMHWHDVRIDEYKTKKAFIDEQKRKEFYNRFYSVAVKYMGLEYNKKSGYIAIIAQKPSDLKQEGEILHHCVGSMNYEQKFVREDSLIFFIRKKEEPSTPFVTVEYSPSQKKILQSYGKNNSAPSEDVIEFITKKWLPFANRQILKMVA